MKARLLTRGLDGLAVRLATRVLPAAEAAAAAQAAADLAAEIRAETGAPAVVAGTPARPVVEVTQPGFADRIRGRFDQPGDPVLDRIRIAFSRRRRPS
ncbi:hypothetical protein EZH22_16915 [Xanthobacter dioxanivorans]|uniref:Uncharacterized protein n=1 Tax=Xanthobacter dioxanivorans TaxID=2528964 RepID=A0A974PJM6_9HYPH|nr:hypothetical protein [Xanthobacter dioxanivorans]QRG04832.1 hypothetical protein EZH22_16915 [Xanthobacter dioxanivorans]